MLYSPELRTEPSVPLAMLLEYHQYIHWVWLFNQFCIPLSGSVVQYTLFFTGNSLKVLSNALLISSYDMAIIFLWSISTRKEQIGFSIVSDCLLNILLQRFSWSQCQIDSSEATRVLFFLLFEDSNICPFLFPWHYRTFHASHFPLRDHGNEFWDDIHKLLQVPWI